MWYILCTCVFVFFQFDAIKRYIEGGGNLLVLLAEGGETKYKTNVNFLLEEYGIAINNGNMTVCIFYMSVR